MPDLTPAQPIPLEAIDALRDEIPHWLTEGEHPHVEDDRLRAGLEAAVPFLREQWKRDRAAVERCWEFGHRIRMRRGEWFCFDCERPTRRGAHRAGVDHV